MVYIGSVSDVDFDCHPMKSLGSFANLGCRYFHRSGDFVFAKHYLQNKQILGLLHIPQQCYLHFQILHTKIVVDVPY